jgi:diguanylate cyclase
MLHDKSAIGQPAKGYAMTDRDKIKILTIEDDQGIRMCFVAFLEDLGFDVYEAENGARGLELFDIEQPDLVLTDLNMPVMDGYGVVSGIKERNPEIPVVVISGAGAVNDAIEAVRRGAWDYITKPVQSLRDLEEVIERVLKRAHQIKETNAYQKNLEGLVSKHSEMLQVLENYDSVTGLPNRSKLGDMFYEAVTRTYFSGNIAIHLLQIHNLKFVNETYGYEFGDQLLVAVGGRLKELVHTPNVISRISGSKFAIMSVDGQNLVRLINDIMRIFDAPFEIHMHEFFLGISIGVSIFPVDGESLDRLLMSAETAMSEATLLGKNRYLFYSNDLSLRVQKRLEMENRLRHALEREEYFLQYQPKFDAKTHHIVGMEVLIRWQPAGEKQVVMPSTFIPILEETGLIDQVGEWVLRTACTQYVTWRSEGMPPLKLSVNVSAHQFHSGTLANMIREVLQNTGMNPSFLCLELTESIVMRDINQTLETLQTIAYMGLKLSLDDFGTGYSSLSYLRRMPFHEIKIDRSFVMNLPNDKNSVAIVESIISMAHNLNMTIVAEGVETKAQLEFMIDHQCEEIQGFYFSKPLHAENMSKTYIKDGVQGS